MDQGVIPCTKIIFKRPNKKEDIQAIRRGKTIANKTIVKVIHSKYKTNEKLVKTTTSKLAMIAIKHNSFTFIARSSYKSKKTSEARFMQ